MSEEHESDDVMGHRGSKKNTLGLTPQDKKLIISSWSLLKKDFGNSGLALFVIFFTDYPQYIDVFPFKSCTRDQLEKEPAVKLHGLRVMRELGTYIDNIESAELLLHGLRQNAMSHRKRNIPKEAYDHLRSSVLKMITQQAGSEKATPEVLSAWDKALELMFKVIVDINEGTKCACATQIGHETVGSSRLSRYSMDARSAQKK